MFLRLKNYISSNTGLLVRLDDICENMNWEIMYKLEDLFKKYKVNTLFSTDKNIGSHRLPKKYRDDLVFTGKTKYKNIIDKIFFLMYFY